MNRVLRGGVLPRNLSRLLQCICLQHQHHHFQGSTMFCTNDLNHSQTFIHGLAADYIVTAAVGVLKRAPESGFGLGT